ncbi:MAG: PAS domain S-box protein [Deltaproteobacteria bacterium]
MTDKITYGARPPKTRDEEKETDHLLALRAAQQESEEKYRNLLDLSPDSVVILQDGKYQFVSSAFTKMFGYTREDIDRGLSFYELVRAEDLDAVRRRYKDRMAGNPVPKTFQIDLVAKDGTLIPCETSAFVRDITERQQNHNALQNVRQELEQRVRERTGELEEKAEKLEEVNTALKVLLKRLDEDKKAIKEKVLFNMRQLVEPNLAKLKSGRLTERQKNLLDILESNLKEIVSPFAQRLSDSFLKLTPTEIQVANFIHQSSSTGKNPIISP